MNEKLYKFIVNSCNKPTIVVDISGVILFYNSSAQKLLKISEDYTLLFDLLDQSNIQQLREAINYTREYDEELTVELKLFNNNLNYEIKILKFLDNDYQEVFLCTFYNKNQRTYDIKNLIIDENTNIQINEKLLKNLFSYSIDFNFIIDQYGFIQDISENYCKTIEVDKEDILYTSFYDLVDINEKIYIENYIKGKEKDKSIRVASLKLKGNLKVNYIIDKIRIIPDDNELFFIHCVPSDFNTLSIETKNKVVDIDFLRSLLHDVNTPINAITLSAKELYDNIKNPDEDIKTYYHIIEQNNDYLNKILKSFAELISLLENDGEIALSKFKFIDIYADIEEEINIATNKYNVEFSFAKMTTTAILQSDKEKLLSLIKYFINIIAITKVNNILFFSAFLEEDNFYVTIKDNFTAASDKFLEIFKKIFVEKNEKVRKELGISKLNITIFPKLMNYLGVDLVLSEKGVGLKIPVNFTPNINEEKSMLEENNSKPEKLEENTRNTIPKTEEKTKNKKYHELSCIYIEDQVDSQLLFKSQFGELKRVDFSPSFEDALPMIKSANYDFIVLDINLEGEYNGIDAMKIIRNTKGYEDVLIVGATAFLMPGDKEKFLNAGFDEFIPKPVTKDKLYPILKNRFNL